MENYSIIGDLQFDENAGKFCIVDNEQEKYLSSLEFGAKFQVLENDTWVDSELAIDSNEKGEMVFALKNTKFKGLLDGVKVRMY